MDSGGVEEMMRKALMTGAVLAAVMATGAGARKIPNTGTPQSMQQLIACRSIADSAQRLACYDRQATIVSEALASRELVVIDKARGMVVHPAPGAESGTLVNAVLAHADDLSGIAVFLGGPASDFVTGTAIPVDGGFSVQG